MESARIPAADARRFLLHSQGLLQDPARQVAPRIVQSMIDRLGFVQIDSIRTVERAHHLILWSRFDDYRTEYLAQLLERKRSLFEHWTHDASAIPTAYFQMWRARFAARSIDRDEVKAWWRKRMGTEPKRTFEHVRRRIREDGPMRSADFTKANGRAGQGAWWGWSPEKAALELLWRAGELAVSHRVNFQKVFDLTERVFPDQVKGDPPARSSYIDWACRAALDRLGFATPGELAGYWGHMKSHEAKEWCDRAARDGEIVPVVVEGADDSIKPKRAFARHDWKHRLSRIRGPRDGSAADRIRPLAPFDPVVRDRRRLQHLFGFDYRFEAFVPAKKRVYGYYVLPLLEGDAFVGRMDPKAHRDRGVLEIKGVWWEPGVRATPRRRAMLDEAVDRLRAFVDAARVERA